MFALDVIAAILVSPYKRILIKNLRTPCSVFESDVDVPGWKAGSAAAYCEKMEKTREREIAEEATGASSHSSSKDGVKWGDSLRVF